MQPDRPARWRAETENVLAMAKRLRREMTPTERLLWRHLRKQGFRRQHVVGRYILDFAHPLERLAIEVDGSVHIGREEADGARQASLEALGWCFLRFSNQEVFRELPAVLARIETELSK